MANEKLDTEQELLLTYWDLTINERINIKAKAWRPNAIEYLIVRVQWGCPWRFGTPYRMPIETGKGYSI